MVRREDGDFWFGEKTTRNASYPILPNSNLVCCAAFGMMVRIAATATADQGQQKERCASAMHMAPDAAMKVPLPLPNKHVFIAQHNQAEHICKNKHTKGAITLIYGQEKARAVVLAHTRMHHSRSKWN
jgi:hypothetical protein